MWATNRHRNPGYPGLDDSKIVNNTVKMLIDLGLSGPQMETAAPGAVQIEDQSAKVGFLASDKNALSALCTKLKFAVPVYEIEEDGPVHCVKYRAQVTVHGTKYAGDWAGVQEDAELSAARKALNAIHAGACGRVVITDQMRAMVSAKGKKAGLPEPPLPGAETGSETWKAWLIDVARISQMGTPSFIEEASADKQPVYRYLVRVGSSEFQGDWAKSKKEAQQSAAKHAYRQLWARLGFGPVDTLGEPSDAAPANGDFDATSSAVEPIAPIEQAAATPPPIVSEPSESAREPSPPAEQPAAPTTTTAVKHNVPAEQPATTSSTTQANAPTEQSAAASPSNATEPNVPADQPGAASPVLSPSVPDSEGRVGYGQGGGASAASANVAATLDAPHDAAAPAPADIPTDKADAEQRPAIRKAGPAATTGNSDLLIKRPVVVGSVVFQAPTLDSAAALLNPKGRLQDYCLKNKLPAPVYTEEADTVGKTNRWRCIVTVGDEKYQGDFVPSKRLAQQAAAAKVVQELTKLGVLNDDADIPAARELKKRGIRGRKVEQNSKQDEAEKSAEQGTAKQNNNKQDRKAKQSVEQRIRAIRDATQPGSSGGRGARGWSATGRELRGRDARQDPDRQHSSQSTARGRPHSDERPQPSQQHTSQSTPGGRLSGERPATKRQHASEIIPDRGRRQDERSPANRQQSSQYTTDGRHRRPEASSGRRSSYDTSDRRTSNGRDSPRQEPAAYRAYRTSRDSYASDRYDSGGWDSFRHGSEASSAGYDTSCRPATPGQYAPRATSDWYAAAGWDSLTQYSDRESTRAAAAAVYTRTSAPADNTGLHDTSYYYNRRPSSPDSFNRHSSSAAQSGGVTDHYSSQHSAYYGSANLDTRHGVGSGWYTPSQQQAAGRGEHAATTGWGKQMYGADAASQGTRSRGARSGADGWEDYPYDSKRARYS